MKMQNMNESLASQGTLSNPPLNLAIDSVAKIILKHMSAKYKKNAEPPTKFDVDLYLTREFQVKMLRRCGATSLCMYSQTRKKTQSKLPAYDGVKRFLNLIFTKLKLNVECGIVALIYIERLMMFDGLPLTTRNWRPLLIASILTASKVKLLLCPLKFF